MAWKNSMFCITQSHQLSPEGALQFWRRPGRQAGLTWKRRSSLSCLVLCGEGHPSHRGPEPSLQQDTAPHSQAQTASPPHCSGPPVVAAAPTRPALQPEHRPPRFAAGGPLSSRPPLSAPVPGSPRMPGSPLPSWVSACLPQPPVRRRGHRRSRTRTGLRSARIAGISRRRRGHGVDRNPIGRRGWLGTLQAAACGARVNTAPRRRGAGSPAPQRHGC